MAEVLPGRGVHVKRLRRLTCRVGYQIRETRPNDRGFEARRLSDDPGCDQSAVAEPRNTQAGGVGNSHLNDAICTSHHVVLGLVFHFEPGDRVGWPIALQDAASSVASKYGESAQRQLGDRVVVDAERGGHERLLKTAAAGVHGHDQRVPATRFVWDGVGQQAFDHRAIRGCPLHQLRARQRMCGE